MKIKQIILGMFAIASLSITSCDSDDDNGGSGGSQATNAIPQNISSDLTLTNDRVWELQGRTVVEAGSTLTIEPGVIVKAFAGQGANASVLIVARDGQIQANGTASQPIIFTSIADNIDLGDTASPNLTQNDRGLWGGVIILGSAPCSLEGDATQVQIEGIPVSDTRGLYGGMNAGDNSGTLNYVSIRHGGTNIGDGNEINGLTLGGVGTGTTISNIEVVANVDDGIEFFGGTVNASNLFVWAVGDDAIDIDQAYSGTIDNAAVVIGDISDHALEIDGPEGSVNGAFTINNLTLIGQDDKTDGGEVADYRSNAQGATNNVYVTGFTGTGTNGDGDTLQLSDVELDNDGVANNYTNGLLSFSNWEVNLPTGVAASADIFDDKSTVGSTFETDASTFSSAVTSPATGANTTAFQWTFANEVTGIFN